MAAKAEEAPPSPLPAAGNVPSGDSLRGPLPQSAGDISSCPLEKRAAPHADAEKRGDDDEPHEVKRRRTFPAALEKISAAADDDDDDDDDDDGGSSSFSFQARSIAPIEMTPKFGSFNSLEILGDTSPSPAAEEEVEKRAGSDEEGKDGI